MENTINTIKNFYEDIYEMEQELKSAGYIHKRNGSEKHYQTTKGYSVFKYSGKYGEGYKVYAPNKTGFVNKYGYVRHSNQYCQVRYYIKEGGAI